MASEDRDTPEAYSDFSVLTGQQLEAAYLVAKGKWSLPHIAEAVGISRAQLASWKTGDEFKTEIERHLNKWREDLSTKGIADQRRRLFRYNDRWRRCQSVIEARAKEFRLARQDGEEAPDYALTGLMTRRKVSIHVGEKEYDVHWEYEVDTGLLAEMRAIEQQAAIECGQWKQRVVVDSSDETVEALADLLSEAEVADLQRRKDDRDSRRRAETEASGPPPENSSGPTAPEGGDQLP